MSIYPRINYEMTAEDLAVLLKSMKPVPALMIGGHAPSSPQENANQAWATLGKKMGFDPMTVQPNGRGDRFFSAVPSETEDQRAARESSEAAVKREKEIADLRSGIAEKEARLAELLTA